MIEEIDIGDDEGVEKGREDERGPREEIGYWSLGVGASRRDLVRRGAGEIEGGGSKVEPARVPKSRVECESRV
ncbi:hypothetical protein KQX54_001369 [Cotesia glomerata]|uniref:Uncharacterized protein n=1 Tax=Cotesia glomerata TaxID=32391 RepID=A0AAV7IAG5_COTGL|nr:hypothetical protein KQX54_001369 [Cotesia glomerata]